MPASGRTSLTSLMIGGCGERQHSLNIPHETYSSYNVIACSIHVVQFVCVSCTWSLAWRTSNALPLYSHLHRATFHPTHRPVAGLAPTNQAACGFLPTRLPDYSLRSCDQLYMRCLWTITCRPLSEEMVQYAVTDAHYLLWLGAILRQKMENAGTPTL